MAGSGLFVATFKSILNNTQLAVNLVEATPTNKWALFTSALTANFDTDTAYGVAPYNANEVSGTGYTAGGTLVVSPTLNSASGVVTYDQADTQWTSSTITGAHYALFYADGLAGNNAICLVDFGADYSTSNGTFLIQWNASGVFTIDLVP